MLTFTAPEPRVVNEGREIGSDRPRRAQHRLPEVVEVSIEGAHFEHDLVDIAPARTAQERGDFPVFSVPHLGLAVAHEPVQRRRRDSAAYRLSPQVPIEALLTIRPLGRLALRVSAGSSFGLLQPEFYFAAADGVHRVVHQLDLLGAELRVGFIVDRP